MSISSYLVTTQVVRFTPARRTAGGVQGILFEIVDESTNGSPAMRDSSGLLVNIPACQMAGRFEFVMRYVLFRGY
jgi:hypothetical protein